MILSLLIAPIRQRLKLFDLSTGTHNYKLNAEMKNTKTTIGGFFYILTVLGTILLLGFIILTFAFNNVYEIKTQVPVSILENQVNNFIADIKVIATFLYYGDSCEENSKCNENISVDTYGITIGEDSFSCNSIDGSCVVTYQCTNCIIQLLAHVQISLESVFSYSSGIFINVTSTSSIPESVSSVFIPFYSNQGQILTGTIPSNFYFIMIPSFFQSSVPKFPSTLTGYHVALEKPADSGSQYSIDELSTANNLYAFVYLSKSDSGVYTERGENQSIVTISIAFLGFVAGISQALHMIMRILEKNYRSIKKKVNKFYNLRHLLEKNRFISELWDEKNDFVSSRK